MTKSSSSKTPMDSPPPKHPSLPPPPQTEFATAANPPDTATTATKNPTLDMDSPPALDSKTLKPPPLSESQISLAAPSAPPPSLKDSTFDTTSKPEVPRLLTEQLPTVKDPTLEVKEPVLLPVEGEEMPTYIPGVGPAIPIPPTPRQVASSSLPQPSSPPIPTPLIDPVQPHCSPSRIPILTPGVKAGEIFLIAGVEVFTWRNCKGQAHTPKGSNERLIDLLLVLVVKD